MDLIILFKCIKIQTQLVSKVFGKRINFGKSFKKKAVCCIMKVNCISFCVQKIKKVFVFVVTNAHLNVKITLCVLLKSFGTLWISDVRQKNVETFISTHVLTSIKAL